MLYIPFVYFSAFLYYTIKKCGLISMPTLLVFVYVLTSFASILIDVTDAYARNCEKIEITLFPTIVYCGLLTLSIYPFLKIKDKIIQEFSMVQKTWILDWIVYVYFFIFVLMVIILTPDLLRNWALASISENLKADFRFGGEKSITVTGWRLFIANRCVLFSFGALNIIPIFFYNLCFRNKKKIFHFITIIGSMTILFTSILNQDRSRIVYWMMLFTLCFVFFYKFMDDTLKLKMKKVFVVLFGIGVAYVVIMNIRRFSSDYNDSMESFKHIVNYAGQSFINFCHFFEKINIEKINITAGFPLTSYLLDINYDSLDWYDYVENKTGFYAVVFSTFIGELISYMGIPLTLFWIAIFYVIAKKCVRIENMKSISFYRFQVIFTLICVPYLGIFGHYYHAFITEFFSIIFLILGYYASFNKKL